MPVWPCHMPSSITLSRADITLKLAWNFTNYKWRNFERKMPMCWITEVFFQTSWVSKLSPNPSQGPHALSPETCSSVAVCLAGLPPPARRQPAVPEVSGCLPQSLEVKSPACPTSTHRAPGAVCSAEPEPGEPGFGSWNPRLLGSPGQHPTKQTSVSVLSLPMWSPNECQLLSLLSGWTDWKYI